MISVEPEVSAIAETPLKDENNTVAIVLTRDMIVKIYGNVTGKLYVFNGAGSINEVDEVDVENIVQNNLTPSCCGSYPTPTFQIIGR